MSYKDISNIKRISHHGDVVLVELHKLPEGLTVLNEKTSVPVAYGEDTGHRHLLENVQVLTAEPEMTWKDLLNLTTAEEGMEQVYFVADKPTQIVHLEPKGQWISQATGERNETVEMQRTGKHADITVPEGVWQVAYPSFYERGKPRRAYD